jgi:hypothetical protein
MSIPGMVESMLKNVVMISPQGEVSNLEMVSRKETIQVEILSNMEYCMKTYYSYNQANADEQREAGLYLFGKEAAQYLENKWGGWVVDVKSQGLIQETRLLPETVKVTNLSETGYHIVAKGELVVQNESYANISVLTIERDVRCVERSFPKNRYGMQFYNFVDVVEEKEKNAELK